MDSTLHELLVLIDPSDLADPGETLGRRVEHGEVAVGFGVVIQVDADSAAIICQLGTTVVLWAPFNDPAGHDDRESE
jgi:hypothetical protein